VELTAEAGAGATTPDATVSTPDGNSSDSSEDTGTFDVVIQYLDQSLPDIATNAPSGGDGGEGGSGYPWPNCPPFISVNGAGAPTPVGPGTFNEVPAAFSDASASGEVIAADGSVCATYGWLGSPAIDDCITENTGGSLVGDITLVEFPPCVWCEDAGVVAQGTQEGNSRYSVCLALYECIARSGCGSGALGVPSCLCGTENGPTCEMDPNPPGPCANEELASLEELPSEGVMALLYYQSDVNAGDFTGSCAGTLNALYANGRSYACFPSDGGSP
jgi:hypothetical protein